MGDPISGAAPPSRGSLVWRKGGPVRAPLVPEQAPELATRLVEGIVRSVSFKNDLNEATERLEPGEQTLRPWSL